MPRLIPSRKLLEDLEKFRTQKELIKKIAKALAHLETNPHHHGFHLERIVNDPSTWSVRVGRRYRLSFDPETTMLSGFPDWSGSLFLLRIIAHDDLYRRPRWHSADDHSLLDPPMGNQARLPSASLAVSRQAAASHCSSSWAAGVRQARAMVACWGLWIRLEKKPFMRLKLFFWRGRKWPLILIRSRETLPPYA